MTPTERAKRSDALYYETVSVNRRVLCDMVANREADLEDAKAENANLRELMCDMYRSMDVSCQFGHAIPAGTMAHIKNRVIGLGVEVDG